MPKSHPHHSAPAHHELTPRQATRLAALAKTSANALEGLTLAEAGAKLHWIDPTWFWFREICGQVTAPDPVTGTLYPVPFATVSVQETDCDLLAYFPLNLKWGWHFPISCSRETIATVQADSCGNFCVWVPHFEFEWIRRWRLERICYDTIFTRPTIADLLPQPLPGQPDPGPLATLTALPAATVGATAGSGAQALAQRVARLQANAALGAPNQLNAGLLAQRAFTTELPPPLPAEFRHALAGRGSLVAAKDTHAKDGIRGAIAQKLGLDPHAAKLRNFDPNRYIGPFLRCFDIIVPEWQLILEVPDITFLVTQDVDGSGTQQIIYDDSFGADWTADIPNPISLVANGLAKTSRICNPPEVPCGDVPAILFAGLMPLDNAGYFDATGALPYSGCTLRPNRPIEADLSRPQAQTPFCETVQLYGCVNVPVNGATAAYYRVQQSLDGGATYSTITGLAWQIFTFPGGAPVTIAPDSNGWYPVLANPDAYHPARLVLDWPTPLLEICTLKLQVADATQTTIVDATPVPISVDNTVPQVSISLSWKFVGDPDSTLTSLIGLPCPIVRRGATPRNIEVVYAATISSAHLRDSSIYVAGCGAGNFALEAATPPYETSHWYTDPGDNLVTLSGRYTLDATASDGCYGFGWTANSRAMNPSGADGGNLLPTDWFEDVVYIYNDNAISITVISEN